MPPKIRFSKEAIEQAALTIARTYGLEAVNARAVAGELGCSTQPLFREFANMEQIRGEVVRLAMERYQHFVLNDMAEAEKPYKAAGMAYLRFAREEPRLFRVLFMCDMDTDQDKELRRDATMDDVIQSLMRVTGLSREEAYRFHRHTWIFVHGMASMIATNYAAFTAEETDALVADCFEGNRLLFDHKNGSRRS